MKGLLMTLDAMFAVAFMFTAIVLLSSMTFQPLAPRGAYLKQLSLDALTLMEKSKSLEYAVAGDSTEVRRLLEATPPQICMHVSISSANGSLVALIPKNGCGEAGKELQIASRHFVHAGDPYMVKAESWQKRDAG